LQRLEQLKENLLDLRLIQSLRVLLQLLEDGSLDVLEHEVELAAQSEHLEQRHDVLVAQLLEDANLAKGGLANLLVLVGFLGEGRKGRAGQGRQEAEGVQAAVAAAGINEGWRQPTARSIGPVWPRSSSGIPSSSAPLPTRCGGRI